MKLPAKSLQRLTTMREQLSLQAQRAESCQYAVDSADKIREIVERIEARLCRNMRCDDYVVEAQQLIIAARFLVQRIECEAAQLSRAQCADERIAFDDLCARYIDVHAPDACAQRIAPFNKCGFIVSNE